MGSIPGLTDCIPGERVIPNPKIFEFIKLLDRPKEETLPDYEIGLKVAFYIPPFVVDLVGNVIVILIIWMNKRMRTTTNILILNLSISDIMVALFCMWTHLGNQVTTDWKFGSFFCKAQTFIQVVAVTSSVLTLTIISIERFLAIVFPIKGKMTLNKALISISISWIISIGTASPHLFIQKEQKIQWKDTIQVDCIEDWPRYYINTNCDPDVPEKKIYYTVEGIVMYFIPIIIMIVTYSVIVWKLMTRKAPGGGTSSTAIENARRKVVKMLVAILVSFIINWTPQQFLLLWDVYRSRQDTEDVPDHIKIIKYIAVYIAYSNSALNPILYAGFNENFRRGFVDVFKCNIWRHRNQVHSDIGGRSVAITTAGVNKNQKKGINTTKYTNETEIEKPSTSKW